MFICTQKTYTINSKIVNTQLNIAGGKCLQMQPHIFGKTDLTTLQNNNTVILETNTKQTNKIDLHMT